MVCMSERGVTLIELLIVMILLTITLVGLAASFPLALYGVTTGGYQTKATLLALKCIDNAKAIAYSQLLAALPIALDGDGTLVCPNGPFTAYPAYSGTLVIQPKVPTDTTTTVTFTVQFTGQAGGTPTITTLATIIAQVL